MSEHSNKSNPRDNEKETRVNRATLITAILVVAALAVIVSVTVASNRSKKNPGITENTDKNAVTQPIEDTDPDTQEPETEEPETEAQTQKPNNRPSTNTGSSQVENKLPSFILPVSGALSKKHDPTLQVYSATLNDYRCHIGLDIVTAENAPVYAAADGTVSKIWEDPMMGYCMAVKHSGECFTIYKNLAEELPDGIAEGVSVRSGQLIASVGETAMVEIADEPHLHFEMTVSDLAVDPLEYFNEKALESLSIDASFGE